MSEDKEPHITSESTKKNPTWTVTHRQDISTTVADFAKVFIDGDGRMCTFIFYQKHAISKQTEVGIEIDALNQDAFLEVKMPFSTAFGLVLYMNEVLKNNLRGKSEAEISKQSWFGPSAIKQEERKA